ncbi:MAG: hypothetical protein ACYDHN_11520, partial [Solirubrobacteraceae bacterium]
MTGLVARLMDARSSMALAVVASCVVFASPFGASAEAEPPTPAWSVRSISFPTNVSPTAGGTLVLLVSNRGGAPSDGSAVTVTDTLPTGVTPVSAIEKEPTFTGYLESCPITGQTITCTYENPSQPGVRELGVEPFLVAVKLAVAPGTGSGFLANEANVSGGGAPASSTQPSEGIFVDANEAAFGIADFSTFGARPGGSQDTQAGDHPNSLATSFDINTINSPDPLQNGLVIGAQDLKDVVVDLPLGLVGNPQATPRCPESDLTGFSFACPADTVVGTIALNLQHQPSNIGEQGEEFEASTPGNGAPSPIVNVQPEAGYPAQFAFSQGGNSVEMYAKVISTSAGYALQVTAPGISRVVKANGAQLTFFGDPRGQEPFNHQTGTAAALFTAPVDCTQSSFATVIHVDSWQSPGRMNVDGTPDLTDPSWKSQTALSPRVSGCDRLSFGATLDARPETGLVDAPSGYEIELKVPQNEDPKGLATPELKSATVTLPQGVSISPAAADGLQACSAAQIGFDATTNTFSNGPGACPAGSQVGTVKVTTPLLSDPLEGHVFLAEPQCGGAGQPTCTEADAETGRVFGLYLEIEGSGVNIKVPATVEVGGSGAHSRASGLLPGQIRTTVTDAPQQPFSDLKLRLKGGARAPLANPQACGSFVAASVLEPWSHQPGPDEAAGTPDATPQSDFSMSWDGAGGACPSTSPFAPTFKAGTLVPAAGAFSPLTLSLSRADREQNLAGLSVRLPPGLLGEIAGVPRCAEAEASAGTCPQASRIGSVTATAGSGSHPFTQTGQVFFTGPYKGAPFGLSVVVPAKAGPFNLGNIVVRAAIVVDPHSAALSAISDPFPQSIDGVPLRIKSIVVTADRAAFTLNPTSCSQEAVQATVTGLQGSSAQVASPFAATGCRALPFRPTLTASTSGRTSKAAGAALTVRVAQRSGEADIRNVDVSLPKQLPSRLTTLQKACEEAQFAANPAGCPAGSIVGTAVAQTPLLATPLSGPA